MIECEKNCNLCGNLKISSKYNIKLTLCSSCYLITSGWVELALTKVHIPILYLPWWDASDLCIVCDKVLEFKPERQSWCLHCYINYTGCRYRLTTNIISGLQINLSEGILHTIHENNFIHRDFHSGNILLETESFEIMKYTKIIDGERPQVTDDTPVCYVNLMKRCWNSDPSERPSAKEILETTYAWTFSQHCEISIKLKQDLVGNEITQNNTKQYSNSTFKVYVTKVENKEYNLEFYTENERM
ncbi:hypothetical protein RhiirA5_407447 [Rhizophagus irregularis]|uniref:Protein kinase domain-containing protein n=1 Tax=Rhizophagus irregularis TaxID=588596 RepID=A0A2N0QAI3_9GLOM|nr:hypothetical protein RhiirA5_407447 [Rhizophagus irregularis]PKC76219.1 hypothetical protein RhiirA1_447859 [Rhizophagus irregularis]